MCHGGQEANRQEAVALDRVMEIDELVCAALWVCEDRGSSRCVGVRPASVSASAALPSEDPRVQRVLESPSFNWVVSGHALGVEAGAPASPNTYVVFALDCRVVLEVCVRGTARSIASRIDRIHAALETYSDSLTRRDAARPVALRPSTWIDLEFVEAAAMGDADFVRQILGIAAGELESGLEALDRAVRTGDAESLRAHAHRMRSTARSLGAAALDQQLDSLESAADPDLERAAAGGAAAIRDVLDVLRSMHPGGQ